MHCPWQSLTDSSGAYCEYQAISAQIQDQDQLVVSLSAAISELSPSEDGLSGCLDPASMSSRASLSAGT